LSTATLNRVAGLIRTYRKTISSRWRALDPGTQALLTLAHLHKGEPLATLAAGCGISAATAWRRTRETTTTNTDASRSSFRAYGSLGA
jgi:hypothetical protein